MEVQILKLGPSLGVSLLSVSGLVHDFQKGHTYEEFFNGLDFFTWLASLVGCRSN